MGVSKAESNKQRIERLGEINVNKQGIPMKIIEYIDSNNIIVEFLDEYKANVHTSYRHFKNGNVRNGFKRIGIEKLNNQGCLMKVVEYNDATDIVVEFQDEYKSQVHTQWSNFKRGNVKNPYYPSVYGVGVTGNKYPTWKCDENEHTKEYQIWVNMLIRCYDNKIKEKYPTYKDVTCCKEWLLFENFYEWLHKQENFDKWYNNEKWHLDKDILEKGNKVYSPETCCLVPENVNKLFLKDDASRGNLPIGITKDKKGYGFIARCMNPITGDRDYLGYRTNIKEAFQLYKLYKEDLIKQVAKIEFDNGNITEPCYNAMINYEVEITD